VPTGSRSDLTQVVTARRYIEQKTTDSCLPIPINYMTKIKNNPTMKGASGMLAGTVVYRQYQGKTVMSNRPKKRAIMTPRQQSIKSRFLQTVQYAKWAIADSERKAKCQPDPGSEFTAAYIAALADYLRRLKVGGAPLSDTSTQSDTREEIIQNGTLVSAHSDAVVNQAHDPTLRRHHHLLECFIAMMVAFFARVLPPSKEKYSIADLFTAKTVQVQG
jgi:hypothetical protein